MSKNALESVGRKILLIKGNKVVGEGQSILGQGDKFHGISITEGELFDSWR